MAARIVLVDDHPVIRDGLGSLAVLERTRPDVLVLDLSLQERDALPLLAELRSRWPALREFAGGKIHASPAVSERLIARVRQGRQAPAAAGPLEQLTDRERDVLKEIARGLGTREIAAALGIRTSARLVQFAASWAAGRGGA